MFLNNWGYRRKIFISFFIIFMLNVTSTVAVCAENSQVNFGVGLNIPNYPHSTQEDYIEALKKAIIFGGHSSFIWHWRKQQRLEERLNDIANLKKVGLQTFAQMSIALLGEPNPPDGYVKSFDNPETRAIYLDNIRALAEEKPDYMNLSTEANFIAFWMPEQWEHYKSLYQEAYTMIKEVSPETQVGVSYHYALFLWQKQFSLPYELGPFDYLAFTSYPSWLITYGHFASLEDIPSSWYGIVRTAYPDETIIFSEIGWSTEGTGSIESQNLFIQHLPRLMAEARPHMVTWVSLYDLPYFNPDWYDALSPREKELLEELGVDLAKLFERFNAMGLHYVDGTAKPSWDSVLNLKGAW